MASKKTFDEFVGRQVSQASQTIRGATKSRDKWLSHLSEFFASAEGFLGDYISEGKIKLSYGTKRINEQSIGEYEAKTASIAIGESQIRLDPIGSKLIGVNGRVDMSGPNGKVKFVLVDRDISAPNSHKRISILGDEAFSGAEVTEAEVTEWAWKIATPPPNIRYIPLTRESFYDSLMEVANG